MRSIASVRFGELRILRLAFGFACVSATVPAAHAREIDSERAEREASVAAETSTKNGHWIDRFRDSLHRLSWRTARTIDGWAGEPYPQHVYEEASGRLAVGLLWDEFDGWDPKVRFRVDLPTPQLNERVNLFIGRFDPDDFVTDRRDTDEFFPFRRGGAREDETLAGFVYRRPGSRGGDFSASAGLRFKSGSLDPYVKASYRHRWIMGKDAAFTVRETLFYQASEKFGLTSRAEYERIWSDRVMVRWGGTVVVSEARGGMRFNSQLTAIRALGEMQSITVQFEVEGDTDRDVPVQEFGAKCVYRKSVYRPWLALELLAGLSWPRDYTYQARTPSWSLGIAWEMTFGSERLAAEPVSL